MCKHWDVDRHLWRWLQLSSRLSQRPPLGESITATTCAAGGVKVSQLIKACKHQDLHSHCPTLQRLAAVCCPAACCKLAPRTARTNPLSVIAAPAFLHAALCLLRPGDSPLSWLRFFTEQFSLSVYQESAGLSLSKLVSCTRSRSMTVVTISWRSTAHHSFVMLSMQKLTVCVCNFFLY